MEKLDALMGVRRLRLRDGRWQAVEGVIYEEYDETIYLVDRFPVPDDWPLMWTVDFGFTNPFVCQFWALDPDGRMILYREIYVTEGGKRVWTEPRPVAVVCDHDAEGRAVLERDLGLTTTSAHKSVKTGLQAVKGRLRTAGDGRPRLVFMRDVLVERDKVLDEAKKPLCTVDEITSYVWATPRQSALSKAEPEEPLKVDDHGMDGMRYGVAELDLVGQATVGSPARAPGSRPSPPRGPPAQQHDTDAAWGQGVGADRVRAADGGEPIQERSGDRGRAAQPSAAAARYGRSIGSGRTSGGGRR